MVGLDDETAALRYEAAAANGCLLRYRSNGTGWLAGIPRTVPEPNCLAVARMESRAWVRLALCIAIALEATHSALKIHGGRCGRDDVKERKKPGTTEASSRAGREMTKNPQPRGRSPKMGLTLHAPPGNTPLPPSSVEYAT